MEDLFRFALSLPADYPPFLQDSIPLPFPLLRAKQESGGYSQAAKRDPRGSQKTQRLLPSVHFLVQPRRTNC